MTDHSLPTAIAEQTWQDIGWVVTAHAVMLRDQQIVDDAVLAAVLTALDGVQRSRPVDAAGTISDLIAAFEEHLESLLPLGAGGAPLVGRGRDDTAAAVARLWIRRGLLDLLAGAVDLRDLLIHHAGEHAATTMPAFAQGQAVQPTTFGHFLGGVLGPLARVTAVIELAYERANQSPLGAVALASSSLPIDRERTAELAGFSAPIPNTFDAVAATDQFVAAAAVAEAVVSPVQRLVSELLTWLRTEPGSFQIGEQWRTGDASLPQLDAPAGVIRLLLSIEGVKAGAHAVATHAAGAGYGPLGNALDPLFSAVQSTLSGAVHALRQTALLVSDGFEVNRAYLANRAGRGHTTSSDLAIFLMEAEGLSPADATAIAGMTVRRAISEGIEASGITVAMIDASAMLIIGRELGVEFEAISRYLAPRRFLERRAATGGPAPAATRTYLAAEREQLRADARWREIAQNRLDDAAAELERITAEALAQSG